jgi:hypothetical protein
LKRPEGYEDVHPQLVLEDAHINPAFEAEVVAPQPAAASERDGLRLGWTPPSPQRFDFDPKKPKPDHFMAYTVMQLHAAFDAGRALSRAPQAVRMLTDKDLHELWSQHWDGSDSVPYAFLAALGIVPLAPQDTGGK